MELLLLNKADFKDYADQAESLDMDRLRPHILGAQRTRLRPLLLDALTTELLRRVEAERNAPLASPAPLVFPWSRLRTKAVAVVACAAMARYMPFSQTTATSNSMVRKTSQYSEPVDTRDLARQANIYDGDALSYEIELSKWLRANGAEFGSFYSQASCCGASAPSRTPSVVVQGIRRLDDGPRPTSWRPPMESVVPVPRPTPPVPSPDDSSTLPAGNTYPFTSMMSFTIEHNLGRHVSVQVFDEAGQQVEPDVSDVTLNSLTLNFSQPVSGTAVLT